MRFKYIRECFSLFIHSFRVSWQLMCSFLSLSKLHMPVVTVFGGSKEDKEGIYSKKAYAIAKKFVEHDVSILTGGGPGIMEAANCGAVSAKRENENSKKCTFGVAVAAIDTWFISSCYYPTVRVSYFFMRKWLLIRYSVGFIVFPGGIGTMDELFDLLNLLKHNKIPSFPVVLIGKQYWQPLVDWFTGSAIKHGLITEKRLLELFVVTDDMDEAFNIIYEYCKKFK